MKFSVKPLAAALLAALASHPAAACDEHCPAAVASPAPTAAAKSDSAIAAKATSTDSAGADASAPPPFGQTRTLGTVTVTGDQPTSLPTQIPTTVEGITAKEIAERINAFDSEDALKYFPSLLVRKRFVGDYDHAVLATRASGTGNSARSLVFADGILLSNLLGNGASYTPRWGLVGPEEIERVDVLYGPFSAAYPGNSAGAVVDYVTRMPRQFEAHAKLSWFTQDFKLYGGDRRYDGSGLSAALGSRAGGWSWWLAVSRLDNAGHPITFANRLLSQGTPGNSGTRVTGAVADRNPKNQDWLILGDTGQTDTVQDQAKLKIAYDVAAGVRASYTLGWWQNAAERYSSSYLRDSGGNAIYGGSVNIDGRQYSLSAADFPRSSTRLEHFIHGLSLKSATRGAFDWDVSASLYDYSKDLVRSALGSYPTTADGGAGRITDMHGTGWQTLSARGVWRPGASSDAIRPASNHIVEFGIQDYRSKLRTLVSDTADWRGGPATARFSAFNGNTDLEGAYLQDSWTISPVLRSTIGLRWERWRAFGGEIANAAGFKSFGERNESFASPKFALAWQAAPEWTLKGSLGRAVRTPTVAELYQGAISANVIVNNDPNLRAEKSWTGELTAEHDLGMGFARATAFFERTRDALYSQTNVTVTPNVTNIQNVDAMRTHGIELALQANDVAADFGLRGLDLSSSITWTRSIITRNDKFPASVGKWQPRVPDWRANLLATWRATDRWSVTGALRYSGRQYGTLDNSDPNGASYTGVSKFFVVDLRARYQLSKSLAASVGIDNLNNQKYWAFHPYAQRMLMAELKADF